MNMTLALIYLAQAVGTLPLNWIPCHLMDLPEPPEYVEQDIRTLEYYSHHCYYIIDETGSFLYGGEFGKEQFQWNLSTSARRRLVSDAWRPNYANGHSYAKGTPDNLRSLGYDQGVPLSSELFGIRLVVDRDLSESKNTDGFLISHSDFTVLSAKGDRIAFSENPLSAEPYRGGLAWRSGFAAGQLGLSRYPARERLTLAEAKLTGLAGNYIQWISRSQACFYRFSGVKNERLPLALKNARPIRNALDGLRGLSYFWEVCDTNSIRLLELGKTHGATQIRQFPACHYVNYSELVRLADSRIILPYVSLTRSTDRSVEYFNYKDSTWKKEDTNDGLSYIIDPRTGRWDTLKGMDFFGVSASGKFIAYRANGEQKLTIARVTN